MTHDEITQLTGLELRKACLIAAGWRVEQVSESWWQLYDEKGEFNLGGTGNLWDDAPNVESSVDTALEYLPLGTFYRWEIKPAREGNHMVRILEDVTVAFELGNPVATAMCRAWLYLQAWLALPKEVRYANKPTKRLK